MLRFKNVVQLEQFHLLIYSDQSTQLDTNNHLQS